MCVYECICYLVRQNILQEIRKSKGHLLVSFLTLHFRRHRPPTPLPPRPPHQYQKGINKIIEFARKKMLQQDSSSEAGEDQEAETNDGTQFEKSLKELRDLCSHLHQAANYCETSFLNSRHKRNVVDNTKEYICRAVVTVVDHLGSVSANLECRLVKTNSVSEAEIRINSLKQRLGTCQAYSHLLALRTNSWDAHFPRHHPRYILPPIQDPQRSSNIMRSPMTIKATLLETEEEVPLFLYSTFEDSLQGRKSFSTPVLPVRDGTMSISPLKDQHPNFQFLESPKLKRGILNWKLAQNKDLKSLIRRGKRTLTL